MIESRNISACLITKDSIYPPEILHHVAGIGFGEILILTNCPSPHYKQELFRKAKHDYLFYQDDDCIAPIDRLLELAWPGMITCAMKDSHVACYAHSRIALVGWGSIFPKSAIEVLDLYRAEYGEDTVYCRETERIMTWLCFPQNRIELPIEDLPSAFAHDRLSMEPCHYDYIHIVEERCARIVAKYLVK